MTPAADQPDDQDGNAFLSRWSGRKRRADRAQDDDASGKAAPPQAPGPPEAPPPDAEAAPQPEADPDLLASLPRVEDIGPGTDIRAFLQKGVPRALKNAALRRAWLAHPVISTYEDPARDYFWDWNAPGGVPGGGGTISAQDVAEMAQRLFAGAPPETAEPATAAAAEDTAPPATAEPPARPEPAPDVPDPAPGIAYARLDEPPAAPATPRRHGGAMPE